MGSAIDTEHTFLVSYFCFQKARSISSKRSFNGPCALNIVYIINPIVFSYWIITSVSSHFDVISGRCLLVTEVMITTLYCCLTEISLSRQSYDILHGHIILPTRQPAFALNCQFDFLVWNRTWDLPDML